MIVIPILLLIGLVAASVFGPIYFVYGNFKGKK